MDDLQCNICNFKTDRPAKFRKHIASVSHQQLEFLMGDNDCFDEQVSTQTSAPEADAESETESESEIETESENDPDTHHTANQETFMGSDHLGEYFNDSQDERPVIDQWYPFTSKLECLLYIFMNSTTHPVSEEIVKFVLFILKQIGVTNIPSFYRLKNFKIGSFCWEDFIKEGKDNNNVPFWTIKPSGILKLLVAHPDVSKKIIRHPITSDVIDHPACAQKWQEMSFDDNVDNVPVVNMPLNLFLDDTGTHKSRQWKALHCVQMQLSGLPLAERAKQENIIFLGASEKVQIMDVAKDIMDDMRDIQRIGISSFDAHLKQTCIVKSSLDIIVADFNMLSYCCNHLGASANKFCPRCYADADTFMTYGIQRTPLGTQRIIDRLNLRSTELEKKKFRRKKGVKEHENVFWEFIDPHRDIPVGLLHLIPLGLTKHLVKTIVGRCTKAQIDLMTCHLDDVYQDTRFHQFFKYIDSKQGKHFKEYLQIAPINMMYAGVEDRFLKMISLLAMIQRKTHNKQFTQTDIDGLREDVRTYYQMVHQHLPELKKKVKTHLLLHLIEDISRHGPPRSYNEDAFEKNHGKIREMIFLQNQKARSRDTSVKFVKEYLCSHVLTGGYIPEGEEWRQASNDVIGVGCLEPVRKYMGKELNDKLIVCRKGEVSKIIRNKNKHPISEAQSDDLILQALIQLHVPDVNIEDYRLKRGRSVTVQSEELVNSGDWVKYLDNDNDENYGIFEESLIITPKTGSTCLLAVIKKASATASKVLACPRFQLLQSKAIVRTTSLISREVFVHDCRFGNCQMRERLCNATIEHKNVVQKKLVLNHRSTVYLLNVYKL